MKIKEVIERTNLTDRAIRLYIDNGLVSPGIEENYSGRKNIDFTESDVERLNQIALLRKAGFSISDIKEIILNDEKIETIVTKFIEESEQEIKSKREVVEKLKTISFDEKVSLKNLCEKLSNTVKETEVPKEDLRAKKLKSIENKIFRISAIIIMIFSVIFTTFLFIISKITFIYMTNSSARELIVAHGGLILAFILSLILLLLNPKNYSNTKRRKMKSSISTVLISVLLPLTFVSSCFAFVFHALGLLFSSETTDIKNYMKVDSIVEDFEYSEDLYKLFPDEIPASALKNQEREFEDSYPFTTKYYYRYEHTLDPEFNIVAQWMLDENEYEKSKENAKKAGDFSTVQKGDWTCLYFGDTEEKETWANDSFFYLIFAYNDSTRMVRYIACYVVDSPDYGPYYLSLDW